MPPLSRHRFSIALGVAAIALLLVVNFLYALRVPAHQKAQGEWVTHTYEVLGCINALDLYLTEWDAAQRVYALTGDSSYLTVRTSATAEVLAAVERLSTLVADNPRQQARLLPIRTAVAARIKEWNEASRLAAGRNTAPSEPAEGWLPEVRSQIIALRNEEEGLLRSRVAGWNEASRHTRLVVLTGGAVLVVLVGAVVAALYQASRRYREAGEAQARIAALQEAEADRLGRIVQVQLDVASHTRNLQQAMQAIADHACSLAGAEGSIVEMLDGDYLVYRAASGMASGHVGLRLKAENSLSGMCLEENSVLTCNDSETDDRVDREACRRVGLRSMVVVPLRHEQRPVGVLKVLSPKVSAFEQEDTAMFELMAGLLSATLSDAAAAEILQTANRTLAEKTDALEKANAQLEDLATKDGLTGIRNHRTFQTLLAAEFERARRYGKSLSLALLDVDHFKAFNDTFGHPAGDAVLQRVAAILQNSVRATDYAARYGGEEFALLLPETPASGAGVIAERIRKAIADAPWELRTVTVSIGVSTLKRAAQSPTQLITAADRALYLSKKEGRNRVTLAIHDGLVSHDRPS